LFVRFSFDQLFSFVYRFALAIGHFSFIVPRWRSTIFLLLFLVGDRLFYGLTCKLFSSISCA